MEFVGLGIVGIFVGILSSFFGIGGGVLIIPALYEVQPDLSSKHIIFISLGAIFLNTSLNNLRFLKSKALPSRSSIFTIAALCFIGAVIGFQIIDQLNSKTIKLIFAVTLIIVCLKSILKLRQNKNTHNKQAAQSMAKIGVVSFFGSLVSTLTGLGGGVIYTPGFQQICQIKAKKIPPFSNVAMMFSTGFALLSFIKQDGLPLEYPLIIFLGSILGSSIGFKFNDKVKEKTKAYLLTFLLIMLAIRIITKLLV